MREIKLLDCTLRDGGYVNDWKFGKAAISDMIEKLADTHVEVLEVGFLKNEPYRPDRTVFRSMEQVKKQIAPKKAGLEYAVMCEVVSPLPLELLEPRDADSADIIRVIVWKTKRDQNGNLVDALDEGFSYCRGIVERGYKLCVQPARVDQYSDEEFVAMVRRFAALGPMAIYVVDSWGTQNPEQLLHYMRLADENMAGGIALGYHGHNNMMQALSAAQAMIHANFTRDIMIDASVYGMGRGAGNLNLEIIAKYLNEQFGKRYNIAPMLDVCDGYIADIFRQEAWGYSAAYFLTAQYNCNPVYVKKLIQQYGLSLAEAEIALARATSEQKTIFSKANANAMLCAPFPDRELCVVIPTANRGNVIGDCLRETAESYLRYNVDVLIWDSSENNDTQIEVENIQKQGYSNIRYHRYTGKPDKLSIDDKVMDAYRFAAPEYRYVWIIRDRTMINWERIALKLHVSFRNDADFIVLHGFNPDHPHLSKHYTDCRSFFRDQFVDMTPLGITMLKGSAITSILNEIPLDPVKNYTLWHPVAFFQYVANHAFTADMYAVDVFIYHPSAMVVSGGSFWLEFYLWQWSKRFYEMLSGLPAVYGESRVDVMEENIRHYNLYSIWFLLGARLRGGLTFGKCKEYREYIKKVSPKPFPVIVAISFMPKWLAKCFVRHSESAVVKCCIKVGKIIAAFPYWLKRQVAAPAEEDYASDFKKAS